MVYSGHPRWGGNHRTGINEENISYFHCESLPGADKFCSKLHMYEPSDIQQKSLAHTAGNLHAVHKVFPSIIANQDHGYERRRWDTELGQMLDTKLHSPGQECSALTRHCPL